MKNNFRNLIFIFFFNLILFLVFLFAESYLGLYIIGLFSLFLYMYRNKANLSLNIFAVEKIKIISYLWVLFLSFLVITILFSHSVSHSLSILFFYLFSFLFFNFFLMLKKSFYNDVKAMLLKSIILQAFYLSLLSLFLFFFPHYGDSIPPMNLIFSSFGHNHLSSLLIIALPLSWYFSVTPKFNKLFVLISIFLTVSLVMSFGRTTAVLGFLQFLAIFFIFAKNKIKISKKIYLFVFAIFLFAISIFIFTTLNKDFYEIEHCPFEKYYQQLCKPIHFESRPDYWATSFKIIRNFPLVGYGLGTYEFANNKFKESFWEGTGYSHNAFLQMYAETGIIVGTIFLFLMMAMIFKPVFSLYKKDKFFYLRDKYLLQTMVIISLSAIYANILMDFDWSFLGIYLLTLFLITLLLKDTFSLSSNGKNKLGKFSFFNNFLSLILISFAMLYFLVDLLLVSNQVNFAFKIFPYFKYHQFVYLNSEDFSDSNLEKLVDTYKYDSKFFETFLHKKYESFEIGLMTDKQVKKFLQYEKNYCNIYPTSCYFWKENLVKKLQTKADDYIRLNNYELAKKNLILMQKIKSHGYWELNQLGNLYLKTGEIEKARQEFKNCLLNYAEKNSGQVNDDCLVNLERIENNKLDDDSFGKEKFGLDRYEQVSEIIRGEAVWQDFQ